VIRRGIAGLILGLSLLAASLSWSGFLALRTVFDTDRSRDVAEELLDNDDVVSQLATNFAGVIDAAVPADAALPEGLAEEAATAALGDPAVRELMLTAFVDTHRAFLGDGDAPGEVDLTPIAESVRPTLVAAVPGLESVLPESTRLVIPLPTEHIPDASPVESFLERAVPALAIVAVLGAFVALVFTSDRPSILRRAGFWALGTTAVYLVLGLGVPRLLRAAIPDQGEVLAALLTALLRTTIAPSIVLAVCGAGLIVASMIWGSAEVGERRPRRVPPSERRGLGPPRRADRAARAPRQGGPPPPRPSSPPDPYPAPVHRRPSSPLDPTPRHSRPEAGSSPSAGPGPLPAGSSRVDEGSTLPWPDRPAATPAAARSPVTAGDPAARPRHVASEPSGAVGSSPPDAPGDASLEQGFIGSEPAAAGPEPRHGASDETAGAIRQPVPRVGDAASDGGIQTADEVAASRAEVDLARTYRPSWNAQHGWVLHPDDPRPRPHSAHWVDGVGWVVPGPPPESTESGV
jgi:hypothetical protein